MKVVVLCGGRGERMRPLTDDRPKPLVEIGGRPILWHIMKHYAHYKLWEFVLATGYKGEAIRQWVAGGCRLGTNHMGMIWTPDTGEDTQTGGRLLRCRDYLDGDEFMLTYGDGLADVNLQHLLAFHRGHGKIATVTAVRQRLPWGIMGVDAKYGGVVRAFVEKPQYGDWTSAGFFVFNRSVLDRIVGDGTRLEDSTLPMLANEGELVAYRHDGFFKGMDTPADAMELRRLWVDGGAAWKCWE